ncbi:hypothetical protein [Kitasatospora sp. NPDC050543]|uniref:hypothetical protein n=1 Tax=Kitasatospora sp. NPDC050543 TaxID=3364054 RepID=UPI0037B8D149
MIEYQLIQHRAQELQQQAGHRRLVRQAEAARRAGRAQRPGLVRRLTTSGRTTAATGERRPARLHEC